MRLFFPIIALLIAAFSILLDFRHVAPDSTLCRKGLCRFDQVLSAIDAQGINLTNVSALLNQDPLNPLVWCTYGDLLSAGGQIDRAATAFEQATSLGPGMSPVLMRAANFNFANGRMDQGFLMTNQILRQTDAFDQILFSYLTRSKLPVSKLAEAAVPPLPEPSRAWFSWLRGSGSDQDLHELWIWMRQNRLLDQKTAVDFAWAFWRRNAFSAAQDLWADWLGSARGYYLHPQRLANVRFQSEPNGSPFDWSLTAPGSITISRGDGLDIRFSGTENVNFAGVRQFATVNPGRYRFSAEIGAQDITTDQGPFFHLVDPMNPARLSAESAAVKNTSARSWVTLDVSVPPGTQALQVQVERRPSQKFDNKIAGTLHIYQVSLAPVS